MFNPFRAPKINIILTQGFALGCYVTPFQGLKFCFFYPGRCPGLVCYALSGLKILFFYPGRCPALGCYVTPFQGLKYAS